MQEHHGIAIDGLALHPSTRLALAALEWLAPRIAPAHILEIGCGNGLLSITSAHVWDATVLACDISPNAVADSRANIDQYAPGAPIEVIRSDGFKHPRIRQQAPYGLIIANLLAQWQVAMASELAKCLTPDGMVVLSGILRWQQEGVRHAFETLNIKVIQSFDEAEWTCYIVAAPLSQNLHLF